MTDHEHETVQTAGETGDQPQQQESGHTLQQMSRLEQRELLTRLVSQGKRDEEIGEEFGLSQWQVRNLRYKLGIKKDRGGNVYLREPEMDLESHGAQGQGIRGIMGSHDQEAAPGSRPGLWIAWSGTCRAEELASRLDGLQGLMKADLENRLYTVKVEITER